MYPPKMRLFWGAPAKSEAATVFSLAKLALRVRAKEAAHACRVAAALQKPLAPHFFEIHPVATPPVGRRIEKYGDLSKVHYEEKHRKFPDSCLLLADACNCCSRPG